MEKGKISSLQMALLMYPTIVATGIVSVPGITAKYAHSDLWLSPLFASISGYATVYIAFQLHKLYPQQTVILSSQQILGRAAGKIVGFFIIFFYIHTTGEIARIYSEFLISSFFIKTPVIVIMASMILLCAFCVYGGIEVLGRAGQLFVPIFIIPIAIFIVLMGPSFEVENIFPILSEGIMPPIKGAVVPAAWFSEFFLIMFLLPVINDQKKALKYGFITVFAVMVTFFIVNLAVLFVLGTTTATREYPLFVATRYISLADFFENLESIAMAVWIVGAFVKISVFYYASAIGIAQLLNLSDYRPIVWPLGLLIIEFGFWSLSSTMEVNRYLTLTLPFYAPLIQTIIPLLLLGIALIQKKLRKNKASTS